MLILDYLTPLIPFPLDVRGNAQHWFIRTAEAALDRTQPNWHVRYPDQETWDVHAVENSQEKWQPYLKDTGFNKKGLPLSFSKRKRAIHMSKSYEKARVNWDLAFDHEGDDFFDRLLRGTDAVEKSTQEFLALLGLKLRNWLGPFSTHIMLLCGNRDFFNHEVSRDGLMSIHFPEPPIIPKLFRPYLNQELMATLCRDFYLSRDGPDQAYINLLLGVTLGSYLDGAYAGVPFSFIQLERRDETWYLHTHIVTAFAVAPPQARDLRAPFLQLAPPGMQVVLVPDLFAYVEPGDLPIDSIVIAPAAYHANQEDVLVYASRSDTLSLDIQLNQPVPNVISLPAPPLGATWQVVVRTGSPPSGGLAAGLSGGLWAVDTDGQESNHATFLIEGSTPTADDFRVAIPNTSPPDYTTTVIGNLFRYEHAAEVPLAMGHIVLESMIFNFSVAELWLHRSDSAEPDVRMDINLGIVHDFQVLPSGIFWQLYVVAIGGIPGPLPTVFVGHHWCEDTRGFQSNHAAWSITISP